MWGHEFERDPATRVRRAAVRGRLAAVPQFDGAGGVSIAIEVPTEPPGAPTDPGADATIKLWTWPMQAPGLVSTRGAPDAVRTESTPCILELAGKCFDPRRPPRYYGVAVRAFVGLEPVDAFSAVFDALTGEPVHSDRNDG